MLFQDSVGHIFKEEYPEGASFNTICPSCHDAQWSMDANSGFGRCWKCGTKGSFSKFLTKHCQWAKEETPFEAYKELQTFRRIPASIFQRAGIAKHPILDEWWLPTAPTLLKTGIKILRTVGGEVKKRRWVGIRGIKADDAVNFGMTYLYQPYLNVRDTKDVAYICEGEWDTLALWHILEKTEESRFNVIGSPGATSFTSEYARLFSGKNVVIVPQNPAKDEASAQFIEQTAAQLFTFAKSVSVFDWTSFGDDPPLIAKRSKRAWSEVKDVNDVLWAAPQEPGIFADSANWKSIKTVDSKRTKIKRESLQEIYDDLGSYLNLTDAHKKMLRVMLAVFLSCKYRGTPIWMHVHGPSGCGKTEILETLKAHERDFQVSRITRAGLVSGRAGEDDPSVLPRLKMMNLSIKDYTVLLEMPAAELEGVNSIFRDVYDGSGVFNFGGQERSYKDIYFSIIACCTDAILRRNDTTLGERFLRLDALDREKIDFFEIVGSAVDGTDDEESRFTLKAISQQGVAYFIDYLWAKYPDGPPRASEEMRTRVKHAAMVVTKLRAVLPKDEGEVFREEVGTRIGKEFRRLLEFLGMVFQSDEPEEEAWEDLRSVARSSMNSWGFDICESLFLSEEGMTARELAKRLDSSREHIIEKLGKLRTVRAVRSRSIKSTGRGKEQLWVLDPEFKAHWIGAHISTPQSKPSTLYRKSGRASLNGVATNGKAKRT